MGDFFSHRVIIITGHYGSGKTEIALNLALSLKKASSRPVTLADMDIINPYFRSREKKVLLEEAGIKLIGGSIEDSLTGVPALSGEVQAQLNLGDGPLILDSGGDPEGARLLGRYPDEWESLRKKDGLEMLFIINPFRPETSDADKTETMMDRIQEYSGLTVTSLAANGHLLKATGSEEILAGWELAEEISRRRHIPIRFCTLPVGVTKPPEIPADLTFPLTLRHREEWMS